MIKYDLFSEAVIGPAMIWRDQGLVDVLIYDGERMREICMKDGMTADEAREFIEFNYEGAYLGPHTPIIVWPDDHWPEHWADDAD